MPYHHQIKSDCLFYFFNAFFLKTIVPPLGKMGSISSRQKTPGTDPDVEGAGVLTNTKKDVQGGIEDVTDVKDTAKVLVNDIVNDVVENIGKFVLEVVEDKESISFQKHSILPCKLLNIVESFNRPQQTMCYRRRNFAVAQV